MTPDQAAYAAKLSHAEFVRWAQKQCAAMEMKAWGFAYERPEWPMPEPLRVASTAVQDGLFGDGKDYAND